MLFIYVLLMAQYVSQAAVPAIQSQSKTIINSATNPVYKTVDINYMNTPFANSPWVVLSLTSLTNQPNTTAWGFRFNIVMPPLTNQFTVEQTIMGPSTIINYAVIRYLAIDKVAFPNFVMRYINTTLSGSITSGIGPRNQQFLLSVNGGYFYVNQTTSLMSYITGFAGTFNNTTGFQLSASSTVFNSTHFTLTFQTDGDCNFTEATAYTFAFFNNLYSQGDLGYLYGVANQQLNQYTYRVGPVYNYFIGLTYFKFPNANMILDLVNLYDINSTGYTDITFTYLYFNYADPCTRTACMCYDGYDLVAGKCQEICGDGRVYTLPCDDGNLVDFDGCSSACQRQPSYHCLNTGARSQSVCWFNDTIKLTLVSSNRLPFSFTTNMTLSVTPNLTVLETYNWLNITMSKVSIQSATYSNGLLSLLVSYTSTIEQQTIEILTQQQPLFQHLTPSTSTIAVATQQRQYSFHDSLMIPTIIKYSSIAMCILYYLSFIVSLYVTKLVAVEMLAIFQIAYYGLLLIQIKASSVQYLQYLKYVSYNPLLPSAGYFLQSYNLMVISLVIPILAYAIMKVVETTKKDRQVVKNNRWSSRFFKDVILCMFLFNTYPIWISAVFQHRHHQLVYAGIVAIVFMIGVVVMLIVYTIRHRKFKECMVLLKSSLHRYYPSCMFVDRMIMSTILAWSESIYAVMAWQFIILVTAFWKPYEKEYHNQRLIVTHSIIVLILLVYCIMHGVVFQQRVVCEYLPLLIVALLLVGLLVNLAMVVRNVKEDVAERRKEKQDKEKVKEMLMETTFMQVMKDKVERDWNKSFYEEGLKSNRRVNESKISGFTK